MVKRLRFLAAWLTMGRGLHSIHSDWHAWDIGWNAGRRQALISSPSAKQATGLLSNHRFRLSLWGRP